MNRRTNIIKRKKFPLSRGRYILKGWTNLDIMPMKGVDMIADLNQCPLLPLGDNSIDEFFASHVLEHIQTPLDTLEELHRIAKPNAKIICHVSYGLSDDAFEEILHIFNNSI